jgi:hypothetical protein
MEGAIDPAKKSKGALRIGSARSGSVRRARAFLARPAELQSQNIRAVAHGFDEDFIVFAGPKPFSRTHDQHIMSWCGAEQARRG